MRAAQPPQRQQAEQRRFRRFVAWSAGCHVLAALMLGVAPSRQAPLLPPIISVDLLASLPSSAASEPPASEKSAAPAAKPPPKAVPKVAPKPKKIVLPKKAQSTTRKPKKVDRPPKRVKPEELDYAAALQKLRDELGEREPAPEVVAKVEPTPPSGAKTGQRVNLEMEQFRLEVNRHVRARWITPPEFLNRDLVTVLAVDLAPDGRVRGQPRVIEPSGDPFWDDSAIRAILTANPLPAPPEPGEWPISFPSREFP